MDVYYLVNFLGIYVLQFYSLSLTHVTHVSRTMTAVESYLVPSYRPLPKELRLRFKLDDPKIGRGYVFVPDTLNNPSYIIYMERPLCDDRSAIILIPTYGIPFKFNPRWNSVPKQPPGEYDLDLDLDLQENPPARVTGGHDLPGDLGDLERIGETHDGKHVVCRLAPWSILEHRDRNKRLQALVNAVRRAYAPDARPRGVTY